ncbi:MAG: hypothetical protein Q8K86_01565 [Candidatus Nanopelagicaceae bacterium]|nr:hypothetical protein [Candidatus Nanopelagicaceae bacterium]
MASSDTIQLTRQFNVINGFILIHETGQKVPFRTAQAFIPADQLQLTMLWGQKFLRSERGTLACCDYTTTGAIDGLTVPKNPPVYLEPDPTPTPDAPRTPPCPCLNTDYYNQVLGVTFNGEYPIGCDCTYPPLPGITYYLAFVGNCQWTLTEYDGNLRITVVWDAVNCVWVLTVECYDPRTQGYTTIWQGTNDNGSSPNYTYIADTRYCGGTNLPTATAYLSQYG